jgi:hypothetical protein
MRFKSNGEEWDLKTLVNDDFGDEGWSKHRCENWNGAVDLQIGEFSDEGSSKPESDAINFREHEGNCWNETTWRGGSKERMGEIEEWEWCWESEIGTFGWGGNDAEIREHEVDWRVEIEGEYEDWLTKTWGGCDGGKKECELYNGSTAETGGWEDEIWRSDRGKECGFNDETAMPANGENDEACKESNGAEAGCIPDAALTGIWNLRTKCPPSRVNGTYLGNWGSARRDFCE